MRRALVLALMLVLLVAGSASAASGYLVILKNKKKLRCKEPLQIRGDYAVLRLHTGTLASYPLRLIDLVETERYNQLGLGDAILLDELTVDGRWAPTPQPRLPLGSVAPLSLEGEGVKMTPTPTPGIGLRTSRYSDPRVEEAFARVFDDRRLFLYRTSRGTKPEYFYLQAVADDQREVFEVLRVVADVYAVITERSPDIAPAAVELEMVGSTGRPAGTFRITLSMARELASGATSPEQFYVNYVIF